MQDRAEICFAYCGSPRNALIYNLQVVKNQVCDIQACLVSADSIKGLRLGRKFPFMGEAGISSLFAFVSCTRYKAEWSP